MNRLLDFTAQLLEQEGALLEPIEPEGLEVVAPPALQAALDIPELVRLGFGAETPDGAQRVTLESDWTERLGRLMGERGRRVRYVLAIANPPPSDPDRLAKHALELHNATYRLQGVSPAWTRYLILMFRYAAISDEKRDGILHLGLNLSNGSTLDNLLDPLLSAVTLEPPQSEVAVPAGIQLPLVWAPERLHEVVRRTLPGRIRQRLTPFLGSMQRRQERDLVRLHTYYTDLRNEALARLAARREKGVATDKHRDEVRREQLRLEAIAREYQTKVADLHQKFEMSVGVEWVQTLELVMLVQRFALLIRRRKGERQFHLDFNPLVRKLEPPPCEYSYTWQHPREVCDTALHLVSPAAHGLCERCGKPYCRACHPRQCPKCGHHPPPPWEDISKDD